MKSESEKFLPSNVFEGLKSIRAIIKSINECSSERRIEKILYDESRSAKYFREIAWLRRCSEKMGFILESADPDMISSLTLGTHHGGFVAICTERELHALSEDDICDNGFYVMLDGIEDPYNFGTAVRSVFASGANGIIVPPRNWMSSAGIVCRSSAGASELADFYVETPESAIEKFRSRGYRIICSAMENSRSMYECDFTKPTLLIIGGEMRGISKKIIAAADDIVRIDYGRDFPAALSAQSSAAILSFEVYRQRNQK